MKIIKTFKSYYIFLFLLLFSFIFGLWGTHYILSEHNIHFSDIIKTQFYIQYILIIPILTICNLILRFFRWNFLLRHFNIKIPTRELSIYYFTSFIGNLTPFYILHFIRIIPLLKRKIWKGMFIFIIDILLDIFSLLFLFTFFKYLTKETFILIALACILSFIIYYIDKIKKTNIILNLSSLIIFILSSSILIWFFSSFTLYFSIKMFEQSLPINRIIKIFSEMNLINLFSFIPSGIYFSGKTGIELLTDFGISTKASIYIIFLFRLFTIWTAVLIAIFTIIKYRKILLFQDKHFNIIADEYKEQIPEHIRQKVLYKKININLHYLPKEQFLYGLDAGCGQGWYLKEMLSYGYKMKGIDYSEKQVEYAKQYCNLNEIYSGSITELPFKNNEFDFIYTINVLHHLPSKIEQKKALNEFYRVLRPGGRLLIHEINVRNPIYRLYMSYIFPLINSIDEGTEIWIEPYKDSFIFEKFKILNIEYFTFLPDFIPEFLMKFLEKLENKLEKSNFFRKYSAHFCLILEKKQE
ncbi:MAG: hypothetical protein KatS3mg129_1828 [Leptospiraceae bacterium]|nr:MAG: hypothetical protein KatS3mg129_1828 [Leptospiraceae bacterium]